eukprot:GEMP01037171.1.p1 GENE.GEMP01037171.1~~GEMP01037171.1.p1  ORF type:complete len:316 (+),score=48.49 GEMP01037171.1:71-1018(+)
MADDSPKNRVKTSRSNSVPKKSPSKTSAKKKAATRKSSSASHVSNDKSAASPTKAVSEPNRNNDVMIFYSIAAACLVGVLLFFFQAPPLPDEGCTVDGTKISLGWMIKNSQDARTYEIAYQCASVYRTSNEYFLLAGFILTYVTLQTFAIPGPIVLSVLSGALYPFISAHLLVAACATTGASMCFLLSKILGGGLIRFFKLEKGLETFREEVAKNKQHLFTYLIIARSTPIPNILINLGSPHVAIPLYAFTSSTLFGLVPLNCVHILSGSAIASSGTFQKGPLGAVLAAGTVVMAAYAYRRYKAQEAKNKGLKQE